MIRSINFTLWFLLGFAADLAGQTVVSTAKEFQSAVSRLSAGETLVLKDGTYDIGSCKIQTVGSEATPVLVRAEHVGGVTLIGKSSFTLSRAAWVTVEGFVFASDVLTAVKTESAQHCRITHCTFRLTEPDAGTKYPWIRIAAYYADTECLSASNRIDNCLFENKSRTGNYITIAGINGQQSRHDLIDHNIFRNISPRAENEKEAIRIGDSSVSNSDGYTVVEHNVFEDCDGDPEIVSVKSCRDTVRSNTFRRCCGTLSLRQGVRSYVADNAFYGEGKTALGDDGKTQIGCGGIRACSLGHVIVNNRMEGLTGDKFDAAFVLTNGDLENTEANLSSNPSAHFIPEQILFAYNTLKDCKSNIEIGYKYAKSPKNDTIVCNTIIGAAPFMTVYTDGTKPTAYFTERAGGAASTFVIHDNLLVATRIEPIRQLPPTENNPAYNLAGQHVSGGGRGLVIRKGKKYLR